MIALFTIALGLLLAAYIWRDRANIERVGVLFVRRTRRGIKVLDRFSKVPGLKTIYTLAIPICYLGSLFILALITLNSLFILVTPDPVPGVAPIIPGVRIPGSPIFIPFWYGIAALAILLFVHEGSHGIVMRMEKIKVKSTGLLLALIIPGAFVEPDKKNFERAKPISRLRVACAGSFANMVTAVVCILLIMFLLSGIPLRGAILTAVINETPAGDAFDESVVISAINGQKVTNFYDMLELLNQTKPNQTVVFETLKYENGTMRRKEVGIVAMAHPEDASRGFIGIPLTGVLAPTTVSFLAWLPVQPILMVKYISPEYWSLAPWHWKWKLISLLKWTAFLNFAIGLINLMPILPLDGGLMVQEAARKISPKREKKIMSAMNLLVLFLFLVNIMPYFI